MDENTDERQEGGAFWAPGTVRLEHLTSSTTELILHPVPSSDPDDPLNWPTARKTVNFALTCFFVLWTFVQLDIGFTAWGPVIEELGFSVDELNQAAAINYAGLAIGCIFFIPFVHKYGRRPLYLFSSALQLASVVWQAETYTVGDLMGCNIISGLGGAISETVVQITIADIFFVHQHGTANGAYLMFTAAGAFLGPVASGFIVQSQGWRWMWWWCTIFMAINLALVGFFFEESKYIPFVSGRGASNIVDQAAASPPVISQDSSEPRQSPKDAGDGKGNDLERTVSIVENTYTRKTYRQRMSMITKSEGSVTHHFYQPIIVLFCFPAVAYTAITYGSILASFAIVISIQAIYLLEPPYNFGAVGIGLMNIPPFVGSCLGFFVGGYLSDKSIMWLSKRNRGVYEPEMRLWLALVAAVVHPAGILMFGLGLAKGAHWAVLAVGLGLFGFGFIVATDISLAYVTDCYQEIVGDALVGIVFTRNVLSVVVLFALTPWVEGMGVQNLHILTAMLCFGILLLPVPLLKWGKKARVATAKSYERMARRQPAHRTLD